jgi:RimJ/RimL family protein N-acetyltransferase
MQQVLSTSHLTLHPCDSVDIEQLHRHWTAPDVRRYLWDDRIVSQETVGTFVQASLVSSRTHHYGLWRLFYKPEGAFCGVCGLRDGRLAWPELLYSIAPEYWGRGLATESARGILQHVFTALGLQGVVATVDQPNLASIRVLEKLGMSVMGEQQMHETLVRYYAISQERFRHLLATSSAR